MAHLWVIIVAVFTIIVELRCDVINIETTTDNNDATTEQSTTTVENRRIVKLFPKITKKFVVTLSPPVRRPNNITAKKRLIPNVMFRQRLNNESSRDVKNKITRPPLMKPRKFLVGEHNSNTPTNTVKPTFIKRRGKIGDNIKNKSIIELSSIEKKSSNDTNNVFQSDTFVTFDSTNISKIKEEEEDSKSRLDFDASIEINTMSSIFLDESNSSEESNESKEIEIETVKSILKKEVKSRENLSTRKFNLSEEEVADRNEFLFVGSHIKNVKPAASVVKADRPTTKRPRFVMRNPRLQRGIKKISNPATPYYFSTQKLPKKYSPTESPIFYSTQELPFRFYFKLKNIIHV